MKDEIEKAFEAFNLRLKPEFKQELQDSADENKRSLHSEIIHRLENSLKK